ncbi:HD-GYP domain-containing protein [Mesoterricola silvestris]|uniref:Cyclic di-GMP phosphodiesterase n=1 Tax=Mesoterricola silvestris TaxID=2927979 RepID=A0AA48K9A2_9BACT|nr:HD-GYP domain-containing protein [Mesoterricola silvestris]BDU72112.1 cyclic di-GMP phosphodiesterase [Mesoterricola silvestris]
MIKKVKKQDLRLGMFIHDLNCGWMDHSFLRNSFMLRKEADLEKIAKSGITEVYIDTQKGIDVLEDVEAPSREAVEQGVQEKILHSPVATAPGAEVKTSHQEELVFAKQITKEANKVIHSILEDVRLGKRIQVERVEPVINKITDSILRNPGTLVSLCRIREGDTYTFQHSVSVATLLISFCRAMELPPEIIHEAGVGGMLHDIGKMRVPDHILNKPGKLTDAEFTIMKNHVNLGLEVLHKTPGISQAVFQIAGEHHEKFCGTGYPLGKKGADISLLGRMAAIVDVYDAITSNRVYHKGMEPPLALKKIYEWSDPSATAEPHMDEELVQHFIHALGIYPVGSLVQLESKRLAVVLEQSTEGLLSPKIRVMYDCVKRTRIDPFDLDMAATENGMDAIVGNEDPDDWKVNPFDYLDMPKV